jgi:shikimate dehydrogenase
MATSTLRLAGVIGDPVEHSRSPVMHNAAFQQLGIPGQYERWHTTSAQLPERIASLRDERYFGANVTLPHKIAILSLVDELAPEVELIGAANTIVRRADRSLKAYNTDAPAVLATLHEDAGFDLEARNVVILGASGAARAAAFALAHAGIASLTVINRTLERAEELLADLTISVPQEPLFRALTPADAECADVLQAPDLLINATSLGWHAGEMPIPLDLLGTPALVFDMVYRPTELLRSAQARGSATLDGSGMLIRQAALAFQYWTGAAPPVDIMRQAFLSIAE